MIFRLFELLCLPGLYGFTLGNLYFENPETREMDDSRSLLGVMYNSEAAALYVCVVFCPFIFELETEEK